MRSNLCRYSLKVLLAACFTAALVQGCGEKAAPTAAASSTACVKGAKCPTEPGPNVGNGTGTGEHHDDPGSEDPVPTLFDLCKAAKDNSKVSASLLLPRICSNIAALRSASFDGSANKINPTIGGSGKLITVDSTSTSLVNASASDYYKMMRMQINKSADFKAAGFKFDPNAKVDNRGGSDDVPTYHYLNESTDGAVSYRAQSSFVTLKEGVAYAQLTDQTDATNATVTERMTKLQALIVVEQKDTTHSYVYTTTLQTYTENGGDQAITALKARIKTSLGNEQLYSFQNAALARDHAK